MNNIINEFKNLVNNDDNVVALYMYGSRVYKTNSPESDFDFIMVVENKENTITEKIISQHADVTVYNTSEFQKQIDDHEISVLECLFLDNEYKLKETCKWSFTLQLPQLRKSFSAKSSNSWVKAKKKLTIEEDYNLYVGQKSAWHAIRILQFGQQIATTGQINNYTESNALLSEIIKTKDWLSLDGNFRATYNNESTKFKLVAPKEVAPVIIRPKMK